MLYSASARSDRSVEQKEVVCSSPSHNNSSKLYYTSRRRYTGKIRLPLKDWVELVILGHFTNVRSAFRVP